jgi:cystathionine gamma-synthase
VPALDRSTIWPYVDGDPGRFFYARYDHPAGVGLEDALGALDGGRALAYSSGAAASTAVVLALVSPGQTIAVAEGIYFGTPTLLRELSRFGFTVVEFDQTGPPPDGADLIWLEAPSNPFLSFPNLEAAAAHPGRVLVDATASTPVLLRPLEYGANLVLHSATKYLGGHHDALAGALVVRDDEDWERLKRVRGLTGPILAPDVAALVSRGLETLDVRVRAQSAAALELARRLSEHAAVQVVRYPGLGDERAARLMDGGFGGLMSFDVADNAAALTVETSTAVIANATSLGGTHSTMESRYRWECNRVPAGLLRLSVGLEPVEELWADLEQALARI